MKEFGNVEEQPNKRLVDPRRMARVEMFGLSFYIKIQ